MNKHILYIGNNLSKKTNYTTSISLLSSLLKRENKVIVVSDKLNKIARLLEMCYTIIKNHKKLDFVLIDTFSTSNFYYALITSQITRYYKIRYIPILHGGNLPYRLRKSRFFSNLIFKNSYKNVAPSNYLKVEFDKRGYQTLLIPNVLQIEKYPFKKREKLAPKLLWVRSFAKLYNPSLAIDVLKIIKHQFSEAKLCMIGPDRDGCLKDVIAYAKKMNVFEDVEFTGVLSKEQWHKKSIEYDVFINTTNFDNTPISVMEAMALGLPVVSTNVGGLPYLIHNKVDGLLVDKENSIQMAKAIVSLLKGKHPNLAILARQKVEKFDWKVVENSWREILK